MSSFAPGQSRIARLLLSDPDATAFRTINATARAADVHESSVVRFAASLGLDGYPALIALCRQHLVDQAHLVRRFENAQSQATGGDIVSGVVTADSGNLARTFARIDSADWDGAVTVLAEAPNIYVFGMRQCYAMAYLLSYLLHLMRENVYEISTSAGLLVDQLRDMSPGDVFVAVSIQRYTADVVRALAFARRRGLATIVLTDHRASPLAAHGDHVFFVDTAGVSILQSMTAMTCLVQALVTATALRSGAQTRAKLALEEDLFEQFGLYDTDEQSETGA